jgi:hypothetical protein
MYVVRMNRSTDELANQGVDQRSVDTSLLLKKKLCSDVGLLQKPSFTFLNHLKYMSSFTFAGQFLMKQTDFFNRDPTGIWATWIHNENTANIPSEPIPSPTTTSISFFPSPAPAIIMVPMLSLWFMMLLIKRTLTNIQSVSHSIYKGEAIKNFNLSHLELYPLVNVGDNLWIGQKQEERLWYVQAAIPLHVRG